jgi:hypothetical protein
MTADKSGEIVDPGLGGRGRPSRSRGQRSKQTGGVGDLGFRGRCRAIDAAIQPSAVVPQRDRDENGDSENAQCA